MIKIEEKRLNMIVDAVANIMIEQFKANKDLTDPESALAICVNELSGNTEIKMTQEEAIIIAATQLGPVMNTVVDLAHKDNPSHECRTCVLEYVCNPTEEEKDDRDTLLSLLGMNGKGGDA